MRRPPMAELEGDVVYPDRSIAATAHVPDADALREAALADEGGMALQRGLAAQGLPQRAVAELPIRFVRRRPAAAETGD